MLFKRVQKLDLVKDVINQIWLLGSPWCRKFRLPWRTFIWCFWIALRIIYIGLKVISKKISLVVESFVKVRGYLRYFEIFWLRDALARNWSWDRRRLRSTLTWMPVYPELEVGSSWFLSRQQFLLLTGWMIDFPMPGPVCTKVKSTLSATLHPSAGSGTSWLVIVIWAFHLSTLLINL